MSREQLYKIVALSCVFTLAALSANVSLKFLAVSMNQAIGAATPVFAAMFAFLLQGQRENAVTYGTLAFVVGGVVVASGVEPNLHTFGAMVCFLGAAFRGLRAVLQAMLLRPEEKLDSISCLAYMAPVSTVLMFFLCGVLEPAAYGVLSALPWSGTKMLSVVIANCLAAFVSNYMNMVVTKRTSALSIQVLGQCKGIISAVVSVLCFHNMVPVFGWIGYSVTVVGCIAYGRCKTFYSQHGTDPEDHQEGACQHMQGCGTHTAKTRTCWRLPARARQSLWGLRVAQGAPQQPVEPCMTRSHQRGIPCAAESPTQHTGMEGCTLTARVHSCQRHQGGCLCRPEKRTSQPS